MDTYPKNREGLCVGVLSGDRILFQGPPDRQNGGFKQKLLHLSGIQAPKVDHANPTKDQSWGYASREFMRKKLVGKKLKFVIEKKVNEIQIGYVLNQEGTDVTIQLLRAGLARLRGEKIHAKNAEQYADAEEEAKMQEIGLWNQDGKKGYRNLAQISEAQFASKYAGQSLVGIAQEVFPFKSTIYFPKEGILMPITYSDIQVVVLSQKNEKGETKSNGRAIRSLLQSDFLQRQVTVHVSKKNNLEVVTGFLINEKEVDIRKLLLENGHAKLSKQAINTLETKQFILLKQLAHKALQQGKGLWKEQKITKGESISSKEYFAMVHEIHSGDSLSVFNPIKNQIVRIFFPNARAPSNGKPYAHEAKEALRKKCIGKKVKVVVEFSKKINVKKFEGDVGENKNFIFASLFDGQTNLCVWMLEQGLISIQQIRTEEDVSKFLSEMKNADEQSKKAKRGIHSGIDIKLPTYNDISGGKNKKIDASKAKDMFEFLKDVPYLSGTIQLVLNGSRFKVRFHQQNLMAIVVLDGVRCLPNEEQFTKISEEALNYSKHNALQRDIQIKIKRVDLKGIYHATVFLHNKRDFAADLLQNGLAVTVSRNKNAIYEEVQAQARNKKIGLWKFDFNLQAVKGGQVQKQFKPVNFTKKLILIEVVKANQFYLQSDGCKKPEIPQKPNPATSIKVGELYSAQYTVDKVFYRARIIRELKTGIEVFFIDYGNYDIVRKSNIGILDEALKKIKSPLFHCSLYGLDNFTKEATNILKDYINADMKVEMKEQADDGEFRVILYDIENKNKCVNLELLELGQADNTSNNEEWVKAQQSAKRNRQGKWNDD